MDELEAKKMAAGPLGTEMAKFPLKFATAVHFGMRPRKDADPDINNGTATLVDFGRGPIAITCAHVVDGYGERLLQDDQIIFQIGNYKFNPLDNIIDINRDLDLAIINLAEANLDEILSGEEIASSFFKPSSWPPDDIAVGDHITFGGYPGQWRWHPSRAEIVFDSFSSGACAISSSAEDYFVCRFEREYWVESFNIRKGEDLPDLGGLSGSPVFAIRGSTVIYYELVGIVYQFLAEYELMRVRFLKFVGENGKVI